MKYFNREIFGNSLTTVSFLALDILPLFVRLILSKYDSFAWAYLRKLLARGKVNISKIIVLKTVFVENILQ